MNKYAKKTKDIIKWSTNLSYYYIFDHRKAKKYQKDYNLPKPYKRIYHYHNKKTGGTSLNHEFHSLSGSPKETYKQMFKFPHYAFKDKKMYTGWYKGLIENSAFYYAHSHQPNHVINVPKDTFTITIIRDPIKRIISNYRMLTEYYKNGIDHPSMKIYRPMMGRGFKYFINHLPQNDLLHQIHKFSKDYDSEEAYEGITSCSHYFLTKNFDQGIKDLNKKLKMNLNSRHTRKSKIAVDISDKEIKLLKSMIGPEIKLYKKLEKTKTKRY